MRSHPAPPPLLPPIPAPPQLAEIVAQLGAALEPIAAEERSYGAALTAAVMVEQAAAEAAVLDSWEVAVGEASAELAELTTVARFPPCHLALLQLDAARSEARRQWHQRAAHERGEGAAAAHGGSAEVAALQQRFQRAEMALRAERLRLSRIAAVHYPEAFGDERFGPGGLGAKLEDFDDGMGEVVVAGRRFEDYTKVRLLSAARSNHDVWLVLFGGAAVVLKEYRGVGSDARQQRHLRREVRLLQQLSSHGAIAGIDAVFVEQARNVAYVQMPFYEGGNLAEWLRQARTAAADDDAAHQRVSDQLRAIFSEVAGALHHVHCSGVTHADVKLENVLMRADLRPVLSDFELSQDENAGAGATINATTSFGYTAEYVAPEVARDKVHTAAGDMFGFGVCLLKGFARDARAAGDALAIAAGGGARGGAGAEALASSLERVGGLDVDARALLGSLLGAVAWERLSAAEARAHAALDAAARALAAELRVAHDASAAACVRQREEAEAQVRRVRQAEAHAQRELERRQHEAAAELRERERLVARERAAAQAEERRLRGQRAQLAAEEQRVGASRQEVEAQRAAVAASERRARERQKAAVEAEARAQRERQKAERLRGERLALPRYWQRSAAERSELGFALHPISSERNGDIWRPLSRCLHVPNPGWLGHGRDQAEGGRYARLELARAWRIENPTMWRQYAAAQQRVAEDVRRLARGGAQYRAHASATSNLLQRHAQGLPAPLRPECNEAYLLHGTAPATLPNIMSGGANERFSGGLFGSGTYFAEDASKNDQYVTNDAAFGQFAELHGLIYANDMPRHPGR